MQVLTDEQIVQKINESTQSKSFVMMGKELTEKQLINIARKSRYTHLSAYKQILTVEKDRDLRLSR